jgi:hypothetical protein
MPTATLNTIATGVTSNPSVETAATFSFESSAMAFSRAAELISVWQIKEAIPRGRFGDCDLCRWPLSRAQRCAVLLKIASQPGYEEPRLADK